MSDQQVVSANATPNEFTVNVSNTKNLVSTRESREQCVKLLSYDERKAFLSFVKSVQS